MLGLVSLMIDGGMTTLSVLPPFTGCHVQFWCRILMLKRVLVLGHVKLDYIFPFGDEENVAHC